METNPKKSKAIIITIIILIILLIVGFFVFKNRANIFGQDSSMNKIFSSLSPSTNAKTGQAQAGEDIKKGDMLYLYGTNPDGSFIVTTTPNNTSGSENSFGFANEDILNGDWGEITFNNPGGSNGFWDSFYDFINDLFNFTPDFPTPPNECSNGAINYPDCNDFTFGNFPSVSVTANPSSILVGETSTITWASTNTISCEVNDMNVETGKEGSFSTGVLNESKSYSVTCLGENGSISGNAFVYVGEEGGNGGTLFPTVTVTATPSSIVAGESSSIKWDSTNTDSCIVGNIIGNGTGKSGSFSTGALNSSKSYTVACTGKNGSASGNAFVYVNTGCPNGATNPPECDNGGGGWIPECSDGDDNDTDGNIDETDPNCHVGGVITGEYLQYHYDESTNPGWVPACSDGEDNDGDSKIDKADPQCHEEGDLTKPYISTHYSESTIGFTPECSDNFDNDIDDKIDIEDPNCHIGGDLLQQYLPDHFSEKNNPGWIPVCDDNLDNDADNKIDQLDPNCHIDGDLNKAYIPTHFSESSNPPGGFGDPDLRAGAVFPIVATANNPTTLSSLITNSGGSTEHEFSNFFSITKTDPEPQGGGNGGNISKLKKTINKIFDKLSFTSKANAAPGGNTPPESTNAEIIVVMQTLGNFGLGTASISHSFTTTGEYFVRVCADKKSPSDIGTVDESNENNNCGPWTTITVSSSLPNPTICPNGTINPPDCTILPNGLCYNGANNPPECDSYNQCTNGTTNYPLCTVLPNGQCSNGAINPPECDVYSSDINSCKMIDRFPIEFTDEEKAQLAELLRKFYLLAPTLKTEEDIMLTYLEKDEWKNLLAQVGGLKTQCYAQVLEQNLKENPNYTGGYGNETVYGRRYANPYYSPNWRGSYLLPKYSYDSVGLCTPDGSGKNPPLGSCRKYHDQYTCLYGCHMNDGNCVSFNGQSGGYYYQNTDDNNGSENGCKWIEPEYNLADYEEMLNVW